MRNQTKFKTNSNKVDGEKIVLMNNQSGDMVDNVSRFTGRNTPIKLTTTIQFQIQVIKVLINIWICYDLMLSLNCSLNDKKTYKILNMAKF